MNDLSRGRRTANQPIVNSNKSNSSENRLMPPRRPKRRPLKVALLLIVGIIAVLGIAIVVRAANLSGKIFVGRNTSFIKKVGDLIGGATGSVKLIGEDSGQINFLLLGIGGEGHDGPYLSDTIIVAQIRPKDQKVSLVSIPRDYLADLGNSNYGKINQAFADGFARHKDFDEAGQAARNAAEKVSGLTIPYFAVLDFQGFDKAIDLVGGVDVQIDRTFTDYTYPDNKNGYLAPVTFTQGTEHMAGARALIFARSRHAPGPEGSDFARSQRQQKIIQALKAKIISLNLITDSAKINDLLTVLGDHFHTNVDLGEMFHLYQLTHGYSQDNIVSLSLDPSTKLVCDGKIEATGAYIIQPCAGVSGDDIQNFFKNSFSVSKLVQEKTTVWLADSSKAGLLYKSAAKQLTDAGAAVYKVTYGGKPLSQNVVYKVNDKPATMEFILNNLNASEVTLPPPGIKIDKTKVDMVVILGTDNTVGP